MKSIVAAFASLIALAINDREIATKLFRSENTVGNTRCPGLRQVEAVRCGKESGLLR